MTEQELEEKYGFNSSAEALQKLIDIDKKAKKIEKLLVDTKETLGCLFITLVFVFFILFVVIILNYK